MKKADIAVIMGSDSDLPVMKECLATLKEFGIDYDAAVLSAHRTPEKVSRFAQHAAEQGVRVIIAAAGSAAHLAGVIAAQTILPVIGVPLEASSLQGLDALLSTVQMPAGVPVATVAIGKAGAVNAALLAVTILGVSDNTIRTKLESYKQNMIKKVEKKNAALQQALSSNTA